MTDAVDPTHGLRPGDAVQLRGGGPIMTISHMVTDEKAIAIASSLATSSGSIPVKPVLVWCHWHNPVDGTAHCKNYGSHMLVKVMGLE